MSRFASARDHALCRDLRSRGLPVSARQLARWRARGLLPPRRGRRFRGLVLEGDLPPGEVERAAAVARLCRRFPRSLRRVGLLLAASGFDLSPQRVKEWLEEELEQHSGAAAAVAGQPAQGLAVTGKRPRKPPAWPGEGTPAERLRRMIERSSPNRGADLGAVTLYSGRPSVHGFLVARALALTDGPPGAPLADWLAEAGPRLGAAPPELVVTALRTAYVAAQGSEQRERREREGRDPDDFDPDVPLIALDLLTMPGSPWRAPLPENTKRTATP
jgi:hypothetical protein